MGTWKTKNLNLTLIQGQTLYKQYRFTLLSTGAAIDFTGYTGAAAIKDAKGNLIADMTVGFGADSTAGIVIFGLSASTLLSVLPNSYYWDLALKDPAGAVQKPFKGTFILELGCASIS